MQGFFMASLYLKIYRRCVMASEKILNLKKGVVKEITNNIKDSASVVFVDLRGLPVADVTELRKTLRANNADIKVYKNTLTKMACKDLNIELDEYLEGPSAMAFSTDAISPVKIISDFAKKHQALELKVGIVDGTISDKNALAEIAKIPSREGLLTMLAGGMIGVVRDLSICLDLLTKKDETESK
jgi:large subunit ribosomal protein L10